MYLIIKYDKQKAKSIVRLIDLNKISSWREVWKNSYEVKFICWVLEAGDPILARRYIEMNKEHIIKVYAPVALCAPRYSVDLFDEGIHIELITEHHWDICYSLFKKLIKFADRCVHGYCTASRKSENIFPHEQLDVILFGSYARNAADDGSDIDVMFLVDASRETIQEKQWQIGEAAAKVLMNFGIVFSPIVENRAYYHDNADLLPFFKNVKHEGVKIDI